MRPGRRLLHDPPGAKRRHHSFTRRFRPGRRVRPVTGRWFWMESWRDEFTTTCCLPPPPHQPLPRHAHTHTHLRPAQATAHEVHSRDGQLRRAPRDAAASRVRHLCAPQHGSNTHNIQLQPSTLLTSSNYWAHPQQLDEPLQSDGDAAVLAAPQADGDLAADGKRMEPNEHWLVVGTLNVHG